LVFGRVLFLLFGAIPPTYLSHSNRGLVDILWWESFILAFFLKHSAVIIWHLGWQCCTSSLCY
jgi:hypothetical protein